MSTRRYSLILATLLLAIPGLGQAATTLLGGTFDGPEARGTPLPESCGGDKPLAYVVTGNLQVTVSGYYILYDALAMNTLRRGGVDVAAHIYVGPFDDANPERNLVPYGAGDDDLAEIELQAGVGYTLVVQQWCDNREGAWALTLSGPGEAMSTVKIDAPPPTTGEFAATDPSATTACSTGQYHASEPITVARTGVYSYTDVSYWSNYFDICVLVYEGGFDPSRPELNLVKSEVPTFDYTWIESDYLDDDGTVRLEAGKTYTFVVQPLGVAAVGEYFFLLAPPAPFRINKSLAGAWFNPTTDGQGFFMDVYDSTNQMFVGWYTYDLQRPVDGTATLGEPGHRWLTALGDLGGGTAGLKVYLAQGGVFDAADPPIEDQSEVGTMSVEFTDCISGVVDYNLHTPPVAGRIEVQPLTYEHVELCESLTGGPGLPGPL